MAFALFVLWKREEEGWTIESVFFAKLLELFGSGLIAKDGDGRIAGDELDQERHEGDDGPNNEEENEHAAQAAEKSIPKLGSHWAGILAENPCGKAEPCLTSAGEAVAKVALLTASAKVATQMVDLFAKEARTNLALRRLPL
jgi:hypothetical protein